MPKPRGAQGILSVASDGGPIGHAGNGEIRLVGEIHGGGKRARCSGTPSRTKSTFFYFRRERQRRWWSGCATPTLRPQRITAGRQGRKREAISCARLPWTRLGLEHSWPWSLTKASPTGLPVESRTVPLIVPCCALAIGINPAVERWGRRERIGDAGHSWNTKQHGDPKEPFTRRPGFCYWGNFTRSPLHIGREPAGLDGTVPPRPWSADQLTDFHCVTGDQPDAQWL